MALSTPSSDGRYYWFGNANGVTGGQMTFVGDQTLLTGTAALTWSIMQRASDGSYPIITYSLDGGVTLHSAQVGSEGTPQATINESGLISVPMAGATGFIINVTSGGGSVTPNAAQWVLALAITRNTEETLAWDTPNPFDPLAFNMQEAPDMSGDPNTDTLVNLRTALLKDLGYATQAANPTPGMAAYCNNVLFRVQKWLYRKYPALNTRRFFRWKLIPGQRFYSLRNNDDGPTANAGVAYRIDPLKHIEWAGVQDTRNVWYPLIEGIPPQLYTMITKPWRPARYTIRQGIEVYPAPDQTYWLWLRGHFGLMPFAADADITTLDSELVYLYSLARAKAHYGHPDANDIAAQAKSYRGELIAGTHKTAHYVPGTTAVPPAVRPTLIQFQDNQSG